MSVARDFEIIENHRPHRHVEAAVTEQGLANFQRDGFLVLPNAIAPDQAQRLIEATERIASDEGMKPGASGMFLRHLMDKDEAFVELLDHPQFLPVARLMLGPMVRALPVTARIAVPGAESQSVDWHIHQRLVPKPMPAFFSLPIVIDTLIYLDDVDEETGPLQVVPGSHLITDHGIADHSADQDGQVTLMPRAGDAIMMHGNVWHRALPTTERGHRRRLIIFPVAPAWVELPSFGHRPENGLLAALATDADDDFKELLGDCNRIY